jgi:four helix bundle protein
MEQRFDHENLDVYKVSLAFVSWAAALVDGLRGRHRPARDQLLRASQSIPLNIAEGNGKRAGGDRRRYFEIARGSATESAAILDVLVATGAVAEDRVSEGKGFLLRIVAMLTRMAPPHAEGAREEGADYENDSPR